MGRFHLAIWAVIIASALVSTAAAAQPTDRHTSSGPAGRPPELTVAPMAPSSIPAAGRDGELANICEELVAFLQKQQARSGNSGQGDPKTAVAVQGAPSNAGQAGRSDSDVRAQGEPHSDKPVQGQTNPNVDEPQQQSGQSGPIPGGNNTTKAPPVTLEEALDYAARNDVLACRDAAQRMRRAGVNMPDILIVLAALRPDLLTARQGGGR